jgi:hypothetical protein
MNPSLENHSGWQWCTAEGAELHTLLLGLRSSFLEKVRWLEEAETLTLAMRPAKPEKTAPLPPSPSR